MNHFYVNTYMLETSLVHTRQVEGISFIISGSLYLGIDAQMTGDCTCLSASTKRR